MVPLVAARVTVMEWLGSISPTVKLSRSAAVPAVTAWALTGTLLSVGASLIEVATTVVVLFVTAVATPS